LLVFLALPPAAQWFSWRLYRWLLLLLLLLLLVTSSSYQSGRSTAQ